MNSKKEYPVLKLLQINLIPRLVAKLDLKPYDILPRLAGASRLSEDDTSASSVSLTYQFQFISGVHRSVLEICYKFVTLFI